MIPLTTELKKLHQPTHYVLKGQHGLEKTSMSEAEQPVTINKSQVVRYLGKASKHNMAKIDETLRISLHLEPEDPLPVSEFVEWTFTQK